MAAPSNWTIFNLAKYAIGHKQIDLVGDTFKLALFTSSSNCANAALSHTGSTPPLYSDLTNEVSSTNTGYSTGGATVSTSWADASGTETFTTGTAMWTAGSANLVARYAVLYDSTSSNLIGYMTLDSSPADVTTYTGNQLAVQAAGLGIFTMA